MNKFIVFFSLTALLSCHNKYDKVKPTIEDISESVYASGIVKSKNQYQVYSTVIGIVKEVLVTEGDHVNIGSPLIKIFNKTSSLNTKNAQLAADYARVSSNREKLNELKLAIEIAKSKRNNDSLLFARQQNLWEKNVGTKVELEQRELNYKNSILNYQSAETRYKEYKRQLELTANQSQNNLQITEILADDYIVKSEVKGKVYDVIKTKGELVTLQTPVALIGDDTAFVLELQVDEYDIAKVRNGQSVVITMDSYKNQVFKGIISKINPTMNERTKSFTVEADFSSRPQQLFPFLSVEANIIIQTKRNVITIPRSYLIDENFVITEGGKKKQVTVGLKDYEKAEIINGITADEFILKLKE